MDANTNRALELIELDPDGVAKLGAKGDPKGDIERILGALVQSARDQGNIGEKIGAMEKLINKAVEDITKLDTVYRGSTAQGYKGQRVKNMITARDFKKFAWDAVIKAPTEVVRTYGADGFPRWAENDHPVALLQNRNDEALTYGLLSGTHVAGQDGKYVCINPETFKSSYIYQERYLPALRDVQGILKGEAFDIATAGGASDWIPTEYSAVLWEKVRLELRVAGLFMPVDMPRTPYVIPVWLEDLTAFLMAGPSPGGITTVGSGIADDATTFAFTSSQVGTITSNKTLNAKGVAGMFLVTKDLENDAIIDTIAWGQRALVICLARAWDDAIINGDTAGSHQDSDVTAALDRRKVFDGLRKTALAQAATKSDAGNVKIWNGTTNNWTLIGSTLRGLMGARYGGYPNNLILIVGAKLNLQIIQSPDFRTAASLGGNAAPTILTGALGSMFGQWSPDGFGAYVVSEFAREDQNASGVFDNTTTTRNSAILTHKMAWARGQLRGVTLTVLREVRALQDQDVVLAKMRIDFKAPIADSSTNPHTCILYNITS